MKLFVFLTLFASLVFAQESPNVYWNSLAAYVAVGAPLVDDSKLFVERLINKTLTAYIAS